MTKYFVWVSGLHGPEAQIWSDDVVDGHGKNKNFLFKQKLTLLQESVSLNDLMKVFENERPSPQN